MRKILFPLPLIDMRNFSNRTKDIMKKVLFVPLVSGLLLLMALLSACGSDNTASPGVPSTAKTTGTKMDVSTPTPKSNEGASNGAASTPTGSCNATYGCGVGSSNLIPYKGDGYTINFPGSWPIKSDGSNGNVFSMPDGSASLHVFVQDSSSVTNPL
jgi:hypothetical protein